MCPQCQKAFAQCICKKLKDSVPVGNGQVRITRSTKGRKGKEVSIISGLPLTNNEVKSLAKELRKKCGSGGSEKNGTIEIQGDHRELILQELKKKGWDVKLSGG